MQEEIKKLQYVIEEVLSEDKRARNSDKWLLIQVLRRMGFKIYVDYNDLDQMPCFESIGRIRRKIQNEQGKYLPEDEVKKGRKENEKEMKEINVWY